MKIIVLSMPFGLAHVTRPLEVARALTRRGHEVLFAGTGRYMDRVREAGFKVRDLDSQSESHAREEIKKGWRSHLYPRNLLDRLVTAELALFKDWSPDLVLTDARVTATTSAELAGIPCVTIINAHMSRFREIPFADMRGWFPPGRVRTGLERAMNQVEMWAAGRILYGDLRALRKSRGLPNRPGIGVEEGTLTLLADAPEFNPTRTLPPTVRYVGPLTWRAGLPPPRCVAEGRLDPRKPLVYVSINSAGTHGIVDFLTPLARRGIQFLVATGVVAAPPQTPPGVFVEPFVDVDWVYGNREGACRADLAVCYGGNGTLYQALMAGVPVLGFATHAEQYYGLKRVNELGVGRGHRWRELERYGYGYGYGLFEKAVLDLLADSRLRERTEALSHTLGRWAGAAERAADSIERMYAPAGKKCVLV